MTRQPFISPGVFGPEAIAGMSDAYDAALISQPNAVPETSPDELFQRQHLVSAIRFACRQPDLLGRVENETSLDFHGRESA